LRVVGILRPLCKIPDWGLKLDFIKKIKQTMNDDQIRHLFYKKTVAANIFHESSLFSTCRFFVTIGEMILEAETARLVFLENKGPFCSLFSV